MELIHRNNSHSPIDRVTRTVLVTVVAVCMALIAACASTTGSTYDRGFSARGHSKYGFSHRNSSAKQSTRAPQPAAESKIEPADVATDTGLAPLVQPSTSTASTDATIEIVAPTVIDDGKLSLNDPNNAWDHIKTTLKYANLDHPSINKAMRPYVKNPRNFERVAAAATPYLQLVVAKAKAQGLPGEAALLPFVESGFNAQAYSRHGAAGIWQFTAGTGRTFGLKQNSWYDGRLDINASTDAAVRYLKNLHDELNNDWLLAMAGYNTGPRVISAAIARNRANGKPVDLWHLKLPAETWSHIARLLAFSKLVAHNDRYNISLKKVPMNETLSMVDVGSRLDLATAARVAGVPEKKIRLLNPGYRRGTTGPNGPHRILLPSDAAGALRDGLKTVAIADRTTGVAIDSDNAVNTRKSKRSHAAKNRIDTKSAKAAPVAKHKIRKGDTLWTLAQNYGISVQDICRWNNIRPKAQLKPGQPLIVRGPA